MHALLYLVVALAVVAALVLPAPLIGRALEHRRSRAALQAVADRPEVAAPPSAPTAAPALGDLDMVAAVDEYVQVVGAEYRRCASAIGAALAAFVAPGQRADGQPRAAIRLRVPTAAASVEVALLRMRHGILEPLDAYRPATTVTEERSFAALRALLDAEDRAAVA